MLSSIVTLAVFPFRRDATCAGLYKHLTAQESEELTGCLKIEKPMPNIEISKENMLIETYFGFIISQGRRSRC
jgi:hypothetical protein